MRLTEVVVVPLIAVWACHIIIKSGIASAPFHGVTSCPAGWIAVLPPMVMDILFIGSFAVKAWELLASRYLRADASLRIVFLACKNPELKYAGDGTSVNRIHESGCGFALC